MSSQIEREVAARLGAEADAINEAGEYVAPSGRNISIRAELEKSREGTVYVSPGDLLEVDFEPGETVIEVVQERTLDAARRLKNESRNPVVLNFASAIVPGGGYLTGSRAQEESIAWSSGLVPALECASEFYELHRRLNDPHHTDAMIYSPDVPVFRDGETLLESPWAVSVISVAAPKVPGALDDAAREAFRRRIPRILNLGLRYGHDTIVLGAWGCGAFGNDPEIVAPIFKDAIDAVRGAYRKIIFAIADSRGTGKNIEVFRRVLA